MAVTKLSRWEQETVINFNNEEKLATVYTADPVVQRKLDKYVEKYPNEYKCIKCVEVAEDQLAKTYEVSNKKLISFRAPVHMSDEQKKNAAERLANYRKNS